jgi:hypothetical protein
VPDRNGNPVGEQPYPLGQVVGPGVDAHARDASQLSSGIESRLADGTWGGRVGQHDTR